MVYPVTDGESFKRDNLDNWRLNSAFWLAGRMRHVHDISVHLGGLIERALPASDSECCLMDLGCGEGWIYRLLRQRHRDVRYVGVDYNPDFIAELKRRAAGDAMADFLVHDIEQPLPPKYDSSADIVVNCFNFFELPNVENGFLVAAELLKRTGRLLIVTIDPVIQLLAISHSHSDFLGLLQSYADRTTRFGYDKEIDADGGGDGHVYRGILYSAADYVQFAAAAGLVLKGFTEEVCTDRMPPQIYQFLSFAHGDE